MTCINLKLIFKAKIDCINTKNKYLVFRVSNIVGVHFSYLHMVVNVIPGHSLTLCSVVSAASLQIMVDHGRKQQENERFSVSVCAPHRLNRGLELNVCVAQCIKLFQYFTSSTTAWK